MVGQTFLSVHEEQAGMPVLPEEYKVIASLCRPEELPTMTTSSIQDDVRCYDLIQRVVRCYHLTTNHNWRL